jgi:hypothetical protein
MLQKRESSGGLPEALLESELQVYCWLPLRKSKHQPCSHLGNDGM